MTRVAGTFAATNASAWVPPDNADQARRFRDRYQKLVRGETKTLNCDLPEDPSISKPIVPDPIFAAGISIGDPVRIDITCKFGVITPIIGNVVGQADPGHR